MDPLPLFNRLCWATAVCGLALAITPACGQSAPKPAPPPPASTALPAMDFTQTEGVPATSADAMRADEAQIVDLAAQMQSEVCNNPHDFLLADFIRKANQIRRLADRLKNEIKLTSRRK